VIPSTEGNFRRRPHESIRVQSLSWKIGSARVSARSRQPAKEAGLQLVMNTRHIKRIKGGSVTLASLAPGKIWNPLPGGRRANVGKLGHVQVGVITASVFTTRSPEFFPRVGPTIAVANLKRFE